MAHRTHADTRTQVSYAIGIAEPLSLFVEDYATSKVSKAELLRIVKENFDLRPGAIVKFVKDSAEDGGRTAG